MGRRGHAVSVAPVTEGPVAASQLRRYIVVLASVYRDTVKLVEKYDVTTRQPGGGGEYPTQDGFGWTNGVMIKLMAIYPDVLEPVMDGAPTAAPPSGPP
jgi:alpha,alpha-trehalase